MINQIIKKVKIKNIKIKGTMASKIHSKIHITITSRINHKNIIIINNTINKVQIILNDIIHMNKVLLIG